ncbi:MAG TPA: thioredoxin-like domain-containing protein [Bacteroidales bacterium]|nr:thioredoxin-like domain-containing protein [Bacteroidales bacterium]
MKKLLLIPLLAASLLAFGQEAHVLSGTIDGLGAGKVYLSKYYGERLTTLDSARTDSSGRFRIPLNPAWHIGLYRLTFGKNQNLDVILNQEEVVFRTDAANPSDSAVFSSSTENRIYYFFIRNDRNVQQKLQVLAPVVDYYPETDDFYRLACRQYELVQKDRDRIFDSLWARYPGSFAMRIVKLYRNPFLPATLKDEDRINYLKMHFFDQVDFQDTLLLNSNAWSNKVINYLTLYSNNRLPQKQLESEFIKAVTVMLGAAVVNPDIYKFILDYVVGGFDKYHFDDVLTYIADNFQDPFACEDQARKTTLQKKLDNFKKIAVGKTAPEIESTDPKGKPVKLSSLGTDYTLVLFWSSECGHCAEMLPRVKEIYDGQKNRRYEVYAVSLDTSRAEWTKFIRDQKLKWINVSDLKGFDSPSANEYNIYATPTMLLLDRQKKIIAKPVSYRELEEVLKENKLL